MSRDRDFSTGEDDRRSNDLSGERLLPTTDDRRPTNDRPQAKLLFSRNRLDMFRWTRTQLDTLFQPWNACDSVAITPYSLRFGWFSWPPCRQNASLVFISHGRRSPTAAFCWRFWWWCSPSGSQCTSRFRNLLTIPSRRPAT